MWDSKNYGENFNFVHEYGKEVMNLLEITEGMTVVDLGCGNGQLTKQLADQKVDVYGIDSSEAMLRTAREAYPQIPFLCEDATKFNIGKKVDAIFSNAVIHWIDDQEGLITNIANQLKVGGQFVCEFGGKGNVESIHAALEREFRKRGYVYKRGFYFPTIGEYTAKLEAHGLQVRFATLFDRPTKQEGEDGLANWIRMFNLLPFQVQGITQEEQEEIIRIVVEELRPTCYTNGTWYADYVRIRIKAIKQ